MKNETTKQFTITLTDSQLVKFASLKTTREGKTDEQLLVQVVDRGLYDLVYRSARNKQQWLQFKAFKDALKNHQEG